MHRLMIILVSYLFCLMGTALAAININTASEAELDALPGIGPSKAAAIVPSGQFLKGPGTNRLR